MMRKEIQTLQKRRQTPSFCTREGNDSEDDPQYVHSDDAVAMESPSQRGSRSIMFARMSKHLGPSIPPFFLFFFSISFTPFPSLSDRPLSCGVLAEVHHFEMG